jgi:RNA polymerase sigma-70 factor (sigma-E family)
MEAVTIRRRVRIPASRLGELYERHVDAATRLAYLLTGDNSVAEDLVQEAFVRLSGRFVHLRNEGAFPAYLRKTIVNLANAHFRRRASETRTLRRRAGMRERLVEDADLASRETLRRALLSLPPRQRAALVLRYFEDLSEAQTAEILRCPVGTVKSMVSRGVNALRTQMAQEVDE